MTQQIRASQNPQADDIKPQTQQTELVKLHKIICKSLEQRTAADNAFISNFIKQNIPLCKLAESISLQFVKNLFKAATIVTPKKDSVIYMNGQKIQQIGIVLTGQLSVLKNDQNQKQYISQIDSNDIFDKLLQIGKNYRKNMKKKVSLIGLQNSLRSSSKQEAKNYEPIQSLISQPITVQSIEFSINRDQFLGFKERALDQYYHQTCVCLNNETSLLLFNQTIIMISLQIALKDKIKRTVNLLRGISCFNLLDLDRISMIIQNMTLRKRKKQDYIYKQGQSTKSFYLLIQGEIKIIKQTHLFQQNPNCLYGNRKKLIQQTFNQKGEGSFKLQKIFVDKTVKKSMLPYANFTSMYNYRPITKNIQIGVVTPISLFGQQQYCEKKCRETNAISNSLVTQYYQISIKRLQEILGNKILPAFMQDLKNSVRKKVLYRQSHYANSINLENKNNLDYFYLQDGKQKQSPRRFRINKFNDLINSKISTPSKKTEQSVSATYTAFNFNKMGSSHQKSKTQRKVKKHEFQSQDQLQYERDPKQLKIMNVTHTWKLMKQKVDKEIQASKKISPFKPIINLKKPLISSDFFYHMDKQSKRIDKQHRKRVGSFNKSYKSSRVTRQDSDN